jgi:hypothetical protein
MTQSQAAGFPLVGQAFLPVQWETGQKVCPKYRRFSISHLRFLICHLIHCLVLSMKMKIEK